MYRFLSNKKKSINEILITYIIATLTNLGSGFFTDVGAFFTSCIDLSIFSVLLMWISLGIVLVINFFLWPVSRLLYVRTRDAYKLTEIMAQNTAECYKNLKYGSGYSWGEDKCLLVASNLFKGYSPEDIVIDDYNSNKYSVNKGFYDEYKVYYGTDEVTKILHRHNNMDRCMVAEFKNQNEKSNEEKKNKNRLYCMVTDFSTNFNKSNKKIFISLQHTDFITVNYYWKKYKAMLDTEKMRIMARLFQKKEIYPNSFCLHLALITKADEVIVTAISSNKKNDYPYTWAVTIGEQVENSDFDEGVDINENYVLKWVKRALLEEFGLYEDQVNAIVAEEGIRVLSLNSEGDINNISLMTVVHLNCSFTEFEKEINVHPEIDKEFSEISVVKIEDIPYVLYQYKEKKDKMHPSSYLRLLMCYLHRKGIKSFVREFDGITQKKSNAKKLFYD